MWLMTGTQAAKMAAITEKRNQNIFASLLTRFRGFVERPQVGRSENLDH